MVSFLHAQDTGDVGWDSVCPCSLHTVLTRRKPLLSLRLPGSFLLRFAQRKFNGLSLFQFPPRRTRFMPQLRQPFTSPAHVISDADTVISLILLLIS